jgi:hypothetical protein
MRCRFASVLPHLPASGAGFVVVFPAFVVEIFPLPVGCDGRTGFAGFAVGLETQPLFLLIFAMMLSFQVLLASGDVPASKS